MCHLKRKKGGIYWSQDKWGSTSLYYIPYIVSDCYNIAAICRWNGTYLRKDTNLKGPADKKVLDH